MNRPPQVLIIGATSAIAQAVARRYASRGARLVLIARNEPLLQAVADDLRVRGATQVQTSLLDVRDSARHAQVLGRAFEQLGRVDVALIAHGTLPDQRRCELSVDAAAEAFEVNTLSVIRLLTDLANRFEQQREGSIAVISSVAGDRGRASNYVYGAAKAAVSTFLDGLGQRLHAHGVQVLCIKPGFVDTPMTRDFDKGPLWASADDVAAGICKAIERRRDVVYVPLFWWPIMLIIRHLPGFVLKRIRL
ncbi:MAG: SDR family oxidoreductase [Gammaproteobacteria bacterium]|nr:SDR family oxidoreductase [Gammaproteobacteria bacterium]